MSQLIELIKWMKIQQAGTPVDNFIQIGTFEVCITKAGELYEERFYSEREAIKMVSDALDKLVTEFKYSSITEFEECKKQLIYSLPRPTIKEGEDSCNNLSELEKMIDGRIQFFGNLTTEEGIKIANVLRGVRIKLQLLKNK